ncbi:single-stranded-DNA-specific exonuclease RecJ [Domibacillus mangrovi]|uniref:single-stranded-DNA-specific exonuclease RecJ n=1 Tax=Domibacillus mangrovi TaxID=1714354 RepID=UPI000AEFC2DC|nr:single-stranded-DNA-specific exonuclease RecJ [Domibacillus mangrovi]
MKEWRSQDLSYDEHPYNFYIAYFSKCFHLDQALTRYLFSLGYTKRKEIVEFLYPSLDQLHDPFLLKDMHKAITRIEQALDRKEKVMIFGDYDGDGQTATSLLYRALKKLEANVEFLIPLRSEGYGLKPTALDNCSMKDVSLIITVDNGTSAHAALKKAHKMGIDVIVTDHHEILQGHPNCYAFVNPKRDDNDYPFKFLAGVGVALKLVQALFKTFYGTDWEQYIWDYLDLAAIGTVTDMMPLKGENRAIVALGIRMMNEQPKPIIKKLVKKLPYKDVDTTTIGFGIGPVLNACGRISDPNISTRFLCEGDLSREDLENLITVNNTRKVMTAEHFVKAEHLIEEQGLTNDNVIVIQGDFHEGIIGLLASRISEKYLKPAIVINESGKGSARSVQNTNFSIVKVILDCSSYLISFGGHQAAAGLSITLSKVDGFRKAIQLAAQMQDQVIPEVQYQFEIPLMFFPDEMIHQFDRLEPYGMGNNKPIFYTKTWFDSCFPLGPSREHFVLKAFGKTVWAFRFNEQIIKPQKLRKILYTVNSSKKRDFLLLDIKT